LKKERGYAMKPSDEDKRKRKQYLDLKRRDQERLAQEKIDRKRIHKATHIEPVTKENLTEWYEMVLSRIDIAAPGGNEALGALLELKIWGFNGLRIQDRLEALENRPKAGPSKSYEEEWRLKRAASKAMCKFWIDVPPPASPPEKGHEFWAEFVHEANATRLPSDKDSKETGKLRNWMKVVGRWEESIYFWGK